MKCCGFGVAIPQSSIGGNVNAGFNLSIFVLLWTEPSSSKLKSFKREFLHSTFVVEISVFQVKIKSCFFICGKINHLKNIKSIVSPWAESIQTFYIPRKTKKISPSFSPWNLLNIGPAMNTEYTQFNQKYLN